MAKMTPRTLSGFMELLPEKQAKNRLVPGAEALPAGDSAGPSESGSPEETSADADEPGMEE